MNDFRARLRAAIEASGYRRSLRSLSLDAALGEKTIANMLQNDTIDTSKTGPGIFSMARVADQLGVSLDWLAGREGPENFGAQGEQEFALTIARFAAASAGQFTSEGRPPSPQAMLRLYARSGGRLEAFEKTLKYCDRYHCPEPGAKSASVKHVGAESLAAITMGTNDKTVLQIALATVADEQFRKKLVDDHQETMRRGCLCTVEELNIQMPNRPVRVKMDYIRVLLMVTDRNGDQEILAYASLIA